MRILQKTRFFWFFSKKLFEIFWVENFPIWLILFFSKDVLKTLLRGPEVSEKKYWVVFEKTAKNIDFVDFEMTDRPSQQAALRAGDPGGERMVGSTQSLDAHGLSELFWKNCDFSPKPICAKFFDNFLFSLIFYFFIKDVLKYVLGGHETIR